MRNSNCNVSFFIIILFLFSCTTSEVPKAEISKTETPKDETPKDSILPTQTPILAKKSLKQIDLTEIKHISPEGRAQDGSLQDDEFNELPIANELLAHGKDSIPFLIGKLNDETEMNRSVISFWYKVHVADIALAILIDFFTKADGKTSTIQGFSWDEFLERGNDKDSMGEAILRKYIKKHGRKHIKARWQKMWNDNKENIFWDETDRCFKIMEFENE